MILKNPPIKGALDENWSRLMDLINRELPTTGNKYREMLLSLKHDQRESCYLGAYRAPASPSTLPVHHDFEGGWCCHLLEMWEIWGIWREGWINGVHVTDALILKGIINHDLNKVYYHYILTSVDPWRTEYGKNPTNRLLTNDLKCIWILNDHGICLNLEMIHAVINAEGGYSKTKTPATSVLAKILYLLDEASGNVMARIDQGTLLDHQPAKL